MTTGFWLCRSLFCRNLKKDVCDLKGDSGSGCALMVHLKPAGIMNSVKGAGMIRVEEE